MTGHDERPADHSPSQAVLPQEELRAALQADQLRLHYQPIVSLAHGRVRGVEALLRWQHPDGGLLMPDDFLPAIAHTPVIREATRWVLRTACAALTHWPRWTVSVNVAAHDVTHDDLVRDVADALAEHDLNPQRLLIELTEHAVVSDLDVAIDVLGQLRALGVGISLDDFGTGYSSLLYLRELPLTEVKIDRTFVTHIGSSHDDAAIVAGVVRLAHAVGIEVVAEGVETLAQAHHLRNLDCTSAQGYLWGPGRPADELDQLGVPNWHRETAAAAVPIPSPSASPDPVVNQRINDMLTAGASLHTIAAALNREALSTRHGTRWSASAVAKTISLLPDDSRRDANR